MTRDRVLAWDGCVNVRDLGGLPLANGGETQFGVVVRADSLAGLTERGWQAVEEYGVRGAIDLRGVHELQRAPRRTIPVTRIPITPLAGPGWEWPSMLEAYLAVLEEFRVQFGQVVDALAAADPPALVHCQGGRDRTGLTVALILDAVGVERVAIAADHALSDDSWAPYNAGWIDRAGDPADAAKRRRIAQPAGRTMVQVLSEVDRRYGGAAAYVGTASLDTIVLRLRG